MADDPYLEVDFRSMEHILFFLLIIVPLDRADKIVKGLPVRSDLPGGEHMYGIAN